MKISVNTFATLQHYGSISSKKGRITGYDGNSIKIKLIDFEDFDKFSNLDPVVIYFSTEGKVCAGNCTISGIDTSKNELTLSVEKFDYLQEKRISERFPLSKLCNIQIGQSFTKYPAIIKNISFNGIMVICDADFPIYQKLKLTIDIGNPIELSAIVIRKSKYSPDKFEYGLKTIYIDETTPKIIRGYLIRLKKGI